MGKCFPPFPQPIIIFSFLFILLVIIKVYEHTQGISLLIEPIQVNNWYVFIFDTFIYTLFLVSLAKQLESVTWLEWTGRRSIVYYFFSGGIPLIVSSLLQRSVWVIQANTIVLLSLPTCLCLYFYHCMGHLSLFRVYCSKK